MQQQQQQHQFLFEDAYHVPPSTTTTTTLQQKQIKHHQGHFPAADPSHFHSHSLSEIGGTGAGHGSYQGSPYLPQILKSTTRKPNYWLPATREVGNMFSTGCALRSEESLILIIAHLFLKPTLNIN
jgi:hypothetical protein